MAEKKKTAAQKSAEKQTKKGEYVGFKAVEKSAKKSGAKDPGAVAAAVGRKKYGKEGFQKLAQEGKKRASGKK